MKKLILLKTTGFLLLLLILLLPGAAFAKTYFVSPKGSDKNSGESSAPFKTIQKAADVVRAGDTVIVRDGTYVNESKGKYIVYLKRGGDRSGWITFRAENKWGAVLDGQDNRTHFGWGFGRNVEYVRVEDFEIKGTRNTALMLEEASNLYFYGNKINSIARYVVPCNARDAGRGNNGSFSPSEARHITYDGNYFFDIGRLPGGCDKHDYNKDHGLYVKGQNVKIFNNIFYNNKSGWAVQIDGVHGAGDISIINNSFYGPNPRKKGHIILWGECNDITIRNNISHSPNHAFIDSSFRQDDDTNIVISNNFVYGGKLITRAHSSYHITDNITGLEEPVFVSLDKPDFRLLPGSPVIGKGFAPGAPARHCDGNPRRKDTVDIGAYEYTGGRTKK